MSNKIPEGRTDEQSGEYMLSPLGRIITKSAIPIFKFLCYLPAQTLVTEWFYVGEEGVHCTGSLKFNFRRHLTLLKSCLCITHVTVNSNCVVISWYLNNLIIITPTISFVNEQQSLYVNEYVEFVSCHVHLLYCMRTIIDLTLLNKSHGPIHVIPKYVLHVYTMDTCSILCCNNMTV